MKEIFNLFAEIGKLKNVPRSGWLMRGVRNPESVSDHCFRVAFISMVIGDFFREELKLDVEKLLKIALIHDVGEIILGDINFKGKKALGFEHVSVKEREIVEEFFKFNEDYYKLFLEYEERSSVEGKIVRAADKFEMMLQVHEYELLGYKTLNEYWENEWNTEDIFDVKIFAELYKILQENRKI